MSTAEKPRERRGAVSRYELLLRWASERGSGSWTSFREAHDWLFNSGQQTSRPVRATTTIHAMSTLGHLETDWDEGRWAIAPTSITILPNAGAHAIVTGARTLNWLGAFEEALAEGDYFSEPHQQDWGPDALFIAASDETAVEALAASLNVNYELCLSERLAKILPSLRDYLAISRSTPAAKGYGFERFNVHSHKWFRSERDAQPGLYRYDVWGRPEFRFVASDDSVYAVDQAIGVHAEIARNGENQIRYRRESVNGTLSVPFGAQLPVLQARTASLCTGLMPDLHGGEWHYPNVPEDTARAIAASLGQSLVIRQSEKRG
jgi:hypothetical protein